MSDDDHPAWIEPVVAVLGVLGFHKVKLRWKLRRWVMERRLARNRRAQKLVHVRYENRVCPECTAVNARDEEACTRCGATLGARAVEVAGRLGLQAPAGTTILLVIALVVVFVRVAMASRGVGSPMGIPPYILMRHGAALGDLWGGSEWWRYATAIVLHAGVFHLGLNLLSLMIVGPFVEEHYGKWMLPPLLLAFGVAGSLGSVALNEPMLVGVGASGAIMGLIGCLAGVGQRMGIRRGQTLRNEMLLWSLFVIFFGFVVDADQWAHLCGFAAGGVFGLVVPTAWFRTRAGARASLALGAVALLAIAATVWAAVWPVSDRFPEMDRAMAGQMLDDDEPTD